MKFTREDYVKELNREMGKRRKVWKTVQGMPECFVSPSHQRQYDVMMELRNMLDTVGAPTIKRMQEYADSIAGQIQFSVFLELDEEN